MSKKSQKEFKQLYHQYHPMVFQMCLGYTKGDNTQADDLSQEVFINIWKALEKFKGNSSLKTWIYRITVNTCLQYLRKEKKKSEIKINRVADKLIIEPEKKLEQNLVLYRAIGQLGEVDRLVIMMVLDEQDYEDIAEVMGINATNLRVKIHRIKKRLKKILENG